MKPYSHLKPRRTMNPPVRHLKTLYSSRTVKRHAENDGISVLLVHHTRKGRADGVIESIAGTGGISAAADTIWRLKRKPEGQAVLEVLGREVEEFRFALRFEKGTPFGWHFEGDSIALAPSPERRELLDLLRVTI